MKWFFLLFGTLVLALVLFLGGITFFTLKNGGVPDSSTPIERVGQLIDRSIGPGARMPSCKTETTFFSVSPLRFEDFTGLEPLGATNPPAHTFPTDHVYFYTQIHDPAATDERTIVPVFAPGDITITRIGMQENTRMGVTDYTVTFRPCREIEGFFIHMSDLSPTLQEAVDAAEPRCQEYDTGGVHFKTCDVSVEVAISAGEEIGEAGGSLSAALDLGLLDTRLKEHAYANPTRWHSEKPRYAQCPLEYFEQEVADELFNRLSSGDGRTPVTAQPPCGEIAQDVPGTAMGAWFAEGVGETYPEDPHLALVRDHIQGEKQVFSVGNSAEGAGIPAGTYLFETQEDALKAGPTNGAFDVVRPGHVFCYETHGRFGDPTPFTILVHMPFENQLQLGQGPAAGCGEGPWAMPSIIATYER